MTHHNGSGPVRTRPVRTGPVPPAVPMQAQRLCMHRTWLATRLCCMLCLGMLGWGCTQNATKTPPSSISHIAVQQQRQSHSCISSPPTHTPTHCCPLPAT